MNHLGAASSEIAPLALAFADTYEHLQAKEQQDLTVLPVARYVK